MFMCLFARCIVIGLTDHIFYLILVFPCFRYTVYRDLYFSSIPLIPIGIPMLSRFTRKPNSDARNAIYTYILFPANDDGIKDWPNYWRLSPMIIQVIPWLFLLSYMFIYSACALMTCLAFSVVCSYHIVISSLLILGQYNLSEPPWNYGVLILVVVDPYWVVSVHRRSNYLMLLPYLPIYIFWTHIELHPRKSTMACYTPCE